MTKSSNCAGGEIHVLALQLGARYWAKVVTIATYLKTRSPHKVIE